MKLHKIRGGTEEELEKDAYTICLGLSLGNRWFTPENIITLMQWALPRTRDFLVVCPADEIHAINLQVRGRKSAGWAMQKAMKMSAELMSAVRDLAEKTFTPEELTKVVYASWKDVRTEDYKNKVAYLYEQYRDNQAFRDTIHGIVSNYVKEENRVFSSDDIHVFGTYILEELPEVVSRVPVRGIRCDAYAYPFDSELTVFIEQLQQGVIFPEIRDVILDTEPKVFLEVR